MLLKMLVFLQDLNSQTEVCRVCAYVHVQPVVDVTQALSK